MLWLKRRSPLRRSKSSHLQVQRRERSRISSQLALVPTNILRSREKGLELDSNLYDGDRPVGEGGGEEHWQGSRH